MSKSDNIYNALDYARNKLKSATEAKGAAVASPYSLMDIAAAVQTIENGLEVGVLVSDSTGLKVQPLGFEGTAATANGTAESYAAKIFNTGKAEPAYASGGGGTSAEYYKCASVDTSTKTWSGYKAVLGENGYSFEDAVTTGLEIKGLTPVVDSIYSADTMIKIGQLKEDLGGFFELTLNIPSNNLMYFFQPYWNSGGYCHVADWGDGTSEDAVSSGTVMAHNYSQAGTYTLKITADCYRVIFGYIYYNSTSTEKNVYDCNFNWKALGNLTDCSDMFGNSEKAIFMLTSLPETVTSASGMFQNCYKMTVDMDTLATNLPADGLPNLTNARYMFRNAGSGNSPQTCTGSQASFIAKVPNADVTGCFEGTNTTA